MSEGNAWEEGGKVRKRRGTRVKKGRSIDEGQAMSGGGWEEGFISVGQRRRTSTPEASIEF